MKKCFLITMALICALLSASESDALSEAQLREIAAKPHTPTLSVEALKIFPAGRAFKLRKEYIYRGRNRGVHELDVSQKWVDGKFIVSEERSTPDSNGAVRVLYFDDAQKCFVEVTLNAKQGIRSTGIGYRIDDTRAVNWKTTYNEERWSRYDMLTTTSNTNCATFNTVLYRQDGAKYYDEYSVYTATKSDFAIADIVPKPGAPGKLELSVAVTLSKADDYVKSRFAIYRDGKKFRALSPARVEDGKLVFECDDAKDHAENVSKSDCIRLED